jgi:putative DNA primase/helicase
MPRRTDIAAAEIAAALGGARREGRGWRCHCPIHGGHSLVVRDGGERLLIKCWGGGCDVSDILAELRRRGLLTGRSGGVLLTSAAAHSHERTDIARRIALAHRVWAATRDARGSPVAHYLAGRGITVPVPLSLRWAPRCWHREAGVHLPAMIGAVRNIDDELIGVHRTYLTPHYRRRDRASLGPVGGGAVRLATVRPDDWLVIGEGIETVASVMQCTGLPGWAALSASGIERLLLPPDARMVLIVADHDANGTGVRAAHNAVRCWLREGRRVRIALPPHVGEDANDLLMGPRSVVA